MTEPQRLSDFPDWGYLLVEYYAAYRHCSAGGSKVIRSHMKLLRKRLSRCISGGPTLTLSLPERKPVCAYLGRALDNSEQDAMRSMIKAIDKIKYDLTWRYGYEKLPRHLANCYAYADILSPHMAR